MSEQIARTPREALDHQLAELATLRNAGTRSPSFRAWRQATLTLIQRIWPGHPAVSERFRRIPFSPNHNRADANELRNVYEKGCAEANTFLKEIRDRIGDAAWSEVDQGHDHDGFEVGSTEDDFPTLDLPPAAGSRPAPKPAPRKSKRAKPAAARGAGLDDLLKAAAASAADAPPPAADVRAPDAPVAKKGRRTSPGTKRKDRLKDMLGFAEGEAPAPAQRVPLDIPDELPRDPGIGIVPIGGMVEAAAVPPSPVAADAVTAAPATPDPPRAVAPPVAPPAAPAAAAPSRPSAAAQPVAGQPAPVAGPSTPTPMTPASSTPAPPPPLPASPAVSFDPSELLRAFENAGASPVTAPPDAGPPTAAPPPRTAPEPAAPPRASSLNEMLMTPDFTAKLEASAGSWTSPLVPGPEELEAGLPPEKPAAKPSPRSPARHPEVFTVPDAFAPPAAPSRAAPPVTAAPAGPPPAAAPVTAAPAGPPPAAPPHADPDAGSMADEFLRTSPVLSSMGTPVRRKEPGDPVEVGYGVPEAAALLELIGEIPQLGVPASRRAHARAYLAELARRIERRELTWETLRDSVQFLMEFPPLARRTVPLLLPFLDQAA